MKYISKRVLLGLAYAFFNFVGQNIVLSHYETLQWLVSQVIGI